MTIFISNNRSNNMLYDWERLLEEHKANEFAPFRMAGKLFPTFDYSSMELSDFNYMQKMINHNIIIPLIEEIEYETEYVGDRNSNLSL
jgi:hypothetical protein